MAKQVLINFKGTFSNLYFWGKGWKGNSTHNKWNEFWKKYKGIYWSIFVVKENWGETNYLVSTGGSIYLYPMDFNGVLRGCGVTCNGSYFDGQMRELEKACKECAEYCGGSFTTVMTILKVLIH